MVVRGSQMHQRRGRERYDSEYDYVPRGGGASDR